MDWKAEADTVIDDIRPFVSSARISKELESSKTRIYLEIVTFENRKMLVSMDAHGFCICDNDKEEHKVDDDDVEAKVYETVNALLDDNSACYREAFAKALLSKINSIDSSSGDDDQVTPRQTS